MMPLSGTSLGRCAELSRSIVSVPKKDILPGDVLVVRTAHSRYVITAREDGWFTVSGGWFEKSGHDRAPVRIRGCTWGGSVIMTETAAACGLCIEFGNRVITTPVSRIIHFPLHDRN